jgi:UDP-GlcNAc:undecaprenyl-phosphate GlcNAc-1-phosphate transferase
VGVLTYQPLVARASAFILTALLVPMLSAPAQRMGLVDAPGGRKRHLGRVPLTGGLAIFTGFSFALLLLDVNLQPYASLVVGMAMMLATGIIDDLIEVSAGAKLLAQIAAAILMVSWGEVQIHDLGNLVGVKPIELGEWAIPFTVLCVLVMINALNMADGTDGLAGGMTFVALIGLFVVGLIGGAGRPLMAVLGILLTTVLAFLLYNLRVPGRRQARIFLGDSGSLMLGFALAWLAVYISQSPERVDIFPVSIAWIVLLPVLDVLTLYVRRVMRGRSPFSADRDHLHHVLLRSGFGPGVTVVLLLVVMGIFGGVGIYGWQQAWPEWALFVGLIPVFFAQYLCSIRAWRMIRILRRIHKAGP